MGKSDNQLDFSRYDKALDLNRLMRQGMEAVVGELVYTREIYEKLNAIFEDSQDGFFITDGEGRVLKVNKAYEEMSGIKGEEILGSNVKELEGKMISYSASLITIRSGKPMTIEQTFYRTGRKAYISSTPLFDDNGNIVMIVSNTRDFQMIEDLRRELSQKNEQVLEYEERMKTIAQQNVNQSQLLVNDPKMYDTIYKALKVSDKDTTVLIQGETGTGKEMLANFIHQNSLRKDKIMLCLNCGAISKDLIETELFGYVGGAFTGGLPKGKPGYFEIADGGTLFLDEIGELPFNVQMKLLRTLQEKEIIRVGAGKPKKVDVRVIAATNRDLMKMVEQNEFRADLYYRLNVVNIEIPPLRERKQDIIPLADLFLKRFNDKFKTNKSLSAYSYKMLEDYEWPGNVRELKNTIEKMVILSDEDIISAADIEKQESRFTVEHSEIETVNLKEILEQIELQYINDYYGAYKTLEKAAVKLGVNVKTLSRRKRYLEQKYSHL
ncbi:sigma-54 interaction domain-containing protein [Frisingicoccus sp.]|uniref:sigma-54 interaction domain-containing protein n=1 Tax=Frisingicoccus sp. TaxID=1918627 RepID=UPI003AB660C3